MFDFHMHSIVSFDGHHTPQQMAEAAHLAGLKEICFTDHIDDDPTKDDPTIRFTAEDYAAAYSAVAIPGVKIRKGMEFGMLSDNQALLHQYLQRYPFDFVLGSVHFCDGVDVYYPPYWEGKTLEQAERRHLEYTLECVRAHDEFDVLGHLTYISKSPCHPTHKPLQLEKYRDVVEEILKTLVAKGKGLEINTAGVDRCGDYHPGREYVQLFRDLGGRIITVGSDAHTADRVGQYTAEACGICREIFGYVCTFEGRKPIFHKL